MKEVEYRDEKVSSTWQRGRGGRRKYGRGGEVGGGNMAEGERWEEEIWQRGRGGRRKYGRGGEVGEVGEVGEGGEVGGGNKNETVIS